MARIFRIFGWFLIALTVASFVFGVLRPDKPLTLPQSALLPAGVLLALAGHFFSEARTRHEEDERRSKFYLEQCIGAYEEAFSLLSDGNNDRAKWIAAGRTLAYAEELSKLISVCAHIHVLQVRQLRFRKLFHETLTDKPAAFFYGGAMSDTTEVAAAAASAPATRGGRVSTSTVRWLEDGAIYAVWRATQWPSDYKDPMDRGFPEKDRAKLYVLFPGLYEYLDHKDHWASASGELFKRTPEEIARIKEMHDKP